MKRSSALLVVTMKRVFALLVVAIILLFCFKGCKMFYGPNNLYREFLSAELKVKIRHRILMDCDDLIYWENFTGEERHEPYYGTINDCIIVQSIRAYEMSVPERIGLIEIAGYSFKTPSPISLYAYRDDEACELKEAYEKGWLTKEHIEEIHERHNEIYEHWLKLQEE